MVSRCRAAIAALAVTLVVVGTGTVGTVERALAQPASAPPPSIQRDIEYGEPGDARNRLDAFVPQDGKTNRPAVVLVHGGGWTGGDKVALAPDALYFAVNGFVAFSITYGVDESSRWPEELEDSQRAVRWVQDNAATYGVDPSRIGLLGSSAGGNLAMLVGTHGVDGDHPPVRAVASWSGPTNLTTLAITNIGGDVLAAPPTVPIPGAETPPGCAGAGQSACIGVIGPQYIQAFMGCTLEDCPDRYRDASPVFSVTPTTPPMFLAGAEIDLVPAEQNLEMANALMAAGVASSLLLVSGENHAEAFRAAALPPTLEHFRRYLVDGAGPKVPVGTPPSVVAGSAPLPPLGADGRFPVPAIPEVATRTGIIGYVWRHAAWFMVGGAVLIVLLVVLVLRRGRRPAPSGAGGRTVTDA